MLWTLAVILVILWALGLVSSYTMGGFIHILLVLAVVAVVISLIRGRRAAGLTLGRDDGQSRRRALHARRRDRPFHGRRQIVVGVAGDARARRDRPARGALTPSASARKTPPSISGACPSWRPSNRYSDSSLGPSTSTSSSRPTIAFIFLREISRCTRMSSRRRRSISLCGTRRARQRAWPRACPPRSSR